MDWRKLITAMVGTIALILGFASLIEAPAHKPDLASHQPTTDKPKSAPVSALQDSEPFEIPSAWDEGSLWDEGPAYDLSR
jgi:hypothetical protein